MRADIAIAQGRIDSRNRLERALQLLRLLVQIDERHDLGPQHVRGDWREDEIDGATCIPARRLPVLTPLGSYKDDRRVCSPTLLTKTLGRLEPVQRGHAHVHQDQRKGLARECLQRAAARVNLDDGVAKWGKHRTQCKTLDGVVINDQDRRARKSHQALRRPARGSCAALRGPAA